MIASLLLVREACRPSDLFDEVVQGPREWLESVERQTPPPMLFRREGDAAKYPRAGFGFVLGGETGERIDTWSGLVTKDLVADSDTTIRLRLSAQQLDTLYAEALDIRLFDDLRLDPDAKHQEVYFPSFSDSLVVRAGSTERNLSWNSSYRGPGKWRDDAKRLYAWIGHVVRMVHACPEYQALPPVRGGYM